MRSQDDYDDYSGGPSIEAEEYAERVAGGRKDEM